MAKIALNPGEEFEHFHTGESYTKHLDGRIQLSFGAETIVLNVNQTVVIPAMVSHTTKNIGTTMAFFDCSGHLVTEQV